MNSTYGDGRGDSYLPRRPFLVDGTQKPLRMVTLPMPKGVAEAAGIDLNEGGDVLAMATLKGRRYAPYLVVKGTVRMLPYPEGVALDGKLNRNRDVVATETMTYEPKFSYAPALWLGGKRVAFPTFPGWTLQTATGINDHGAICGTGLHNGNTRAYVLVPQ